MQSNVDHKFCCNGRIGRSEKLLRGRKQDMMASLRISNEIATINCLNQLFRHFDDLLSSQSNAIVLVIVVGWIGWLLDLLIRSIGLDLRYDTFTCPKCLFRNKSFMKIGSGQHRDVFLLTHTWVCVCMYVCEWHTSMHECDRRLFYTYSKSFVWPTLSSKLHLSIFSLHWTSSSNQQFLVDE